MSTELDLKSYMSITDTYIDNRAQQIRTDRARTLASLEEEGVENWFSPSGQVGMAAVTECASVH